MSVCRLLILHDSCDFLGSKPGQLAETRAELDAFVQEVFASLPRAEHRGQEGSLYLRGLMPDGRPKSM